MNNQDNSRTNDKTDVKPNEKKDLTAREQHFIEVQNHCALCSSPLQIKVESYLDDYYLCEEATCTVCNVKTRVKNHKMQ